MSNKSSNIYHHTFLLDNSKRNWFSFFILLGFLWRGSQSRYFDFLLKHMKFCTSYFETNNPVFYIWNRCYECYVPDPIYGKRYELNYKLELLEMQEQITITPIWWLCVHKNFKISFQNFTLLHFYCGIKRWLTQLSGVRNNCSCGGWEDQLISIALFFPAAFSIPDIFIHAGVTPREIIQSASRGRKKSTYE